jgi:phage-related minor tail protein
MATRSLGVLTLDLIARTAGFVSGMTSAERQVDKSTKKIKNSLGSLKGAIAGAVAGIGFATAVRAIVANTIESENAVRQLEARIKSTGAAAGLSSEQLQGFATELQKITTFGDDAILAMQGVLLTFTNIKGDVFKDATRAALDLSIAMGQDLQSSAVQLGKALNDPLKGITALSKIGVAFTEEQKKLIKSFVEAGNAAAAQRVILKELGVEFGGAAEAASNTFGGG